MTPFVNCKNRRGARCLWSALADRFAPAAGASPERRRSSLQGCNRRATSLSSRSTFRIPFRARKNVEKARSASSRTLPTRRQPECVLTVHSPNDPALDAYHSSENPCQIWAVMVQPVHSRRINYYSTFHRTQLLRTLKSIYLYVTAGHAANSNVCGAKPKSTRLVGSGFAAQSRRSSLIGSWAHGKRPSIGTRCAIVSSRPRSGSARGEISSGGDSDSPDSTGTLARHQQTPPSLCPSSVRDSSFFPPGHEGGQSLGASLKQSGLPHERLSAAPAKPARPSRCP